MKSIYKNEKAKKAIMSLYDEKLSSLNIDYVALDIETQFGNTRVIKTGNSKGKPIILFHGINAGAPLTLEAVKELRDDYQLFAVDTIGQATQSAETVLNIKDDSYALWADEVVEKLNIENANYIGISYGAYILQKLITHKPKTVDKCIFIVPSGLVNGNFWESLTKLSFPLIRFMITKKDHHLKAFTKAFVPENDEFMFKMQKLLLLGVKIDYRRPILLTKKDVLHFKKPIFIMVASDDIFFPGKGAEKRSREIFSNLKEVYFLKNTKHMPSKETYPEIQMKIKEWLN
ncbi:alpha/beta fold hydrolase [Allomuricauda sp. F6463D]|uniref:alpha/beta fold hydrolase n=1 Tax=Allomuricauda sp. F6463D TaxID=2926409 RepID=UPI001FF14269|nr:alpha/beta hydrolase [Muricauda sp. F6463D]MCK0159439.1 alpha/beta hydrolase [Muricauda sp. F6463D]